MTSPKPMEGDVDRDIIVEALNDYDAYMLDDDYDAQYALDKIIERLRERLDMANDENMTSKPVQEREVEKAIERLQRATVNGVVVDTAYIATILAALKAREEELAQLANKERDERHGRERAEADLEAAQTRNEELEKMLRWAEKHLRADGSIDRFKWSKLQALLSLDEGGGR